MNKGFVFVEIIIVLMIISLLAGLTLQHNYQIYLQKKIVEQNLYE